MSNHTTSFSFFVIKVALYREHPGSCSKGPEKDKGLQALMKATSNQVIIRKYVQFS